MTPEYTNMTIRPARETDVDAIASLFDGAVAWLVQRGLVGQWGTVPWSELPQRMAAIRDWCHGPGGWVAETSNDRTAAAIVLGDAPNYVPPAASAEVYVRALVSSRHSSARGAGRRLLRFAKEQTRAAGIRRLRVDCWAGADGELVRYYESVGFRATDRFAVGTWEGQVLQMDLL